MTGEGALDAFDIGLAGAGGAHRNVAWKDPGKPCNRIFKERRADRIDANAARHFEGGASDKGGDRTVDGGETWTVVPTNVNVTLLSVQFLSDDEGWAIGRGGTILRSNDEGKTWVRQESTTKQNLYSINFNKKIGWVVGGAGIVLRYEND